MQTLKRLFALLTPLERKQAGYLLIMILVMAMLDVLGVASIMPFMAVLANPGVIETNSFLKAAYLFSVQFGVNTPEQFLFVLGVVVFLLLVGSLAFKALATYMQMRFALMREYSIGKRLMEGYLHQPYSWFLSHNSADLGKNILSEVSTVISQSLKPYLYLVAHSIVAIALVLLLIITDPGLAFVVALSLVTFYLLVYWFTRGFLARIGVERIEANRERFSVVSEAFGATKVLKLCGLEKVYIERFAGSAKTYAHHQASAQIISVLPRYAIESIAFGGILILILYLMGQNGSFSSVLPLIALYAFAGYRLMPALQQVYAAFSQLRFSGAALERLHNDLMSLHPTSSIVSKNAHSIKGFSQAITLSNIVYRYPEASKAALDRISLRIDAKSTVALVGSTGSGKSTLVDIILGLLDAQEGALTIDGQSIEEYGRGNWQRTIGYVPQQIYLTDNTVVANIAFGVSPDHVDQDAVERAAKIANLHEFVINEMPDGYATIIGENGLRLSGGQRQRIGIARSLYHNPQVLILDEATSALDNLTEQAVMEAVHNLGHEITIIIIAHRLSTVKECNKLFLLDKGRLVAQGTFDELIQKNDHFRSMALTH